MIPFQEILAKHWLPVCKSQDIGKKPVAVQVLDEPVVLFRTPNGLSALRDRCPHRNVPLSGGCINNTAIQCPYHGWRFGGDGVCQQIPGADSATSCSQFKVPAYAVCEKAGLIWIRLKSDVGDNAQPDLPSHCEDKNYSTRLWTLDLCGSLLNALENFLDGTHTHYVHAGLIRAEKAPRKIVTCDIVGGADRIEITYRDEGRQSGIISKWFEPDRVDNKATFILPCIARLDYNDKKGSYFSISAYIVPECGNRARVFAYLSHRHGLIPGWLKHLVIYPFFKMALAQDRKILAVQQDCIDLFGAESFIIAKTDLMRPFIHKLLSGQTLAEVKPITTHLYL